MQKTRTSLTNKALEGWIELLGPLLRESLFKVTSLLIPRLKTSLARQKRRGESGSPCLTPLLQEKKPIDLPLTRKDNFAEWRM